MSIPNTFDPFGSQVIEVPFIQPIMTSRTTWSNHPSFGCIIEGNIDGRTNAWASMDGDDTSYTWHWNESSPFDPMRGVIYKFERDLNVSELRLLCTFERQNEVYVFCGEQDNERLLVQLTRQAKSKDDFLIPLNDAKSNRFRVYFNNPTISYTWFYSIVFSATYKEVR